MKDITKFQGETKWLSNYAVVNIKMPDGITYPTTEHAYQAQKTVDLDQRLSISIIGTPKEARLAGKKLKLRDDWEDIKLAVMETVTNIKFQQKKFAYKLLATGDADLIEGNTWGDTFWGVCNGIGENSHEDSRRIAQ